LFSDQVPPRQTHSAAAASPPQPKFVGELGRRAQGKHAGHSPGATIMIIVIIIVIIIMAHNLPQRSPSPSLLEAELAQLANCSGGQPVVEWKRPRAARRLA